MGRQLTTAAAAERQERNHEGLQHLTPGGIFDRMDIDGVIHENEDPISSGSLSFREVRMENMAKGCGRSDNIEGVERRPRIVIPTVESKVDSLTTTTYTSTVYSTTYTFAVATDYCTTAGYTGALASLSVCA